MVAAVVLLQPVTAVAGMDMHSGPSDYPLWATSAGDQLPATVLRSSTGLQHCWPGSTFLFAADGATIYARDPGQTLNGRSVVAPYDGAAQLPPTAIDTGIHQDGVTLWTAQERPASSPSKPAMSSSGLW